MDDAPSVLQELENLRVQRDWTYRELAGFLGVRLSTLYSAVRRNRANKRTLAKAQRFLDGQREAA